jgi:hypothetical protein
VVSRRSGKPRGREGPMLNGMNLPVQATAGLEVHTGTKYTCTVHTSFRRFDLPVQATAGLEVGTILQCGTSWNYT